MGCFPSKEEDILRLVSDSHWDPIIKMNDEKCIYLRKGGFLIETKIGNIQYGIPPETLKDSMKMGYSVPEYYIIPDKTFDWNDGISLMEFEFPVYYNFFLRKQNKTKLICDQKTANNIRTIFQETLLGPANFDNYELDFVKGYTAQPDIKKELAHFAKNPFIPGTSYNFDQFVELFVFNEKGIVSFEKVVDGKKIKIIVQRQENDFIVIEDNKEIARIDDQLKINKNNYFVCETFSQEKFVLFKPPVFGFTVLGNSHGFDMCGSTTGFIIWINKKGIMVDPPPYSSRALREQGIPPNFIEKIIITHCHADHDSGAFHKLIEASSVEFLSTPTIINSFLRKYSAVSDVSIEHISKLFQYRLIEIGHPTYILGARFTFGYSFHSIPALCFEIEFQDKRFYFSGDTYYNPEKLLELKNAGLFSQARYEFLALRDFSKYDYIFHEAGIPPIHTAISTLSAFPDEIKKRICLVHIAKKDIPPESNLRAIPVGLKNTLVLIDGQTDIQSSILINLNLLGDIELINWIPFNRILEIINCFQDTQFNAKELIITEETYGNIFYIIKTGIVRIFSDKEENKFTKLCYRGDYFGESCIMGDGFRLANVEALTDVELLAINSSDFKWIFAYQNKSITKSLGPMDLIKNLSDMRIAKEAEFININQTVSKMTETQKGLINMYLKEYFIPKGTVLWKKGENPDFCFFIKSGKFRIKIPYQKTEKNTSIRIGTLIGDFPHLVTGSSTESTVEATEDSLIYKFDQKNLQDYLKQYPGFFIILKDKYVVC